MNALMSLAGGYRVQIGQTPAISGARPILTGNALSTLLGTQPLVQVPATVAAVFNLCGQAHRLVSALALAQLSDNINQLNAAQSAQLHRHTLRDHLLHIALMWHVDNQRVDLSTCPLRSASSISDSVIDPCARWFEAQILGQSLDSWQRAWHQGGIDWLLEWAQTAATPAARFANCQRFLSQSAPGGATLVPNTDTLRSIGMAWQREATFAQTPHLTGRALESGTWTRQRLPMPLNNNAWTRLMARLVDAVALLHHSSQNHLAHGALSLDDNTAIAWVEMTRGMLIHGVQCDATTDKILRYSVIAPTEWNLHPQGRLAQALETIKSMGNIDGQATHMQAEALISAFDPCVSVRMG